MPPAPPDPRARPHARPPRAPPSAPTASPHDGAAASPDRRTSRRREGDRAEAAACRFLVNAGLVPLDRQFLRRIGELDLVLVEPGTGTIVFVEVRYRADARRGGAAASVDAAKRRRLRRTAAAWLQRHADARRPARIDVVGLAPVRPRAAARAGEVRGARGKPWEDYLLTWVRAAVDG